jgi:Zn-finger nucleic acid-binding protein
MEKYWFEKYEDKIKLEKFCKKLDKKNDEELKQIRLYINEKLNLCPNCNTPLKIKEMEYNTIRICPAKYKMCGIWYYNKNIIEEIAAKQKGEKNPKYKGSDENE